MHTKSTTACRAPQEQSAGATLGVSSASVSATPYVPLANASNSNTPMGPFQMTVLASASAPWNVFSESGPMSRPCAGFEASPQGPNGEMNLRIVTQVLLKCKNSEAALAGQHLLVHEDTLCAHIHLDVSRKQEREIEPVTDIL